MCDATAAPARSVSPLRLSPPSHNASQGLRIVQRTGPAGRCSSRCAVRTSTASPRVVTLARRPAVLVTLYGSVIPVLQRSAAYLLMLHRGPAAGVDPAGMWTDGRLVDNRHRVTPDAGRGARPVIRNPPTPGS